jgi:NAD(P)-dependent dehydrogenase (short-subunit alcohol dehydrogenase family)
MAGGVLVAGGTGALGEAVLRDLAEAGYVVTASWIVPRERERIEAEMGDSVALVEADLLDAGAAAEAVAAVPDLRAVVNLVGGFASGPKVGDGDPADFERMVRLNLMPAYLLARAAMPRLAEGGGGAFVCVSSRTALEPFPGGAGYAVGKAAVAALVKALDVEYRDDGVRVNAVVPSVIDTPANRESMPNADFSKWVAPAEIARVIRFLVSDESGPVSGAAVPVYGRA